MVTGATGFVGGYVVEELLRRGYRVRCLVRRGSESKLKRAGGLDWVVGDIRHAESVSRAAAGCQAGIHLVGIIAPTAGTSYSEIHVQGARNVVDACTGQGVRRLVHLSALGAREGAPWPYLGSKWEGEQIVRRSSLAFTVFRPSVIHGAGGEFTQMLVRLARAPMCVPVPETGEGLLQPVWVKEVAWLVAQALLLPRTARRVYEVGGAQVCTLEELVQTVSRLVNGKRRCVIRIPRWLLAALAAVAEKVMKSPWLTREQVGLLAETNVCSLGPAREDFGFRPQGLEESLRTYLHRGYRLGAS